MINQVIKTKAQAKKVANAMKKDINTLLSIYESYSVRMEDDDDSVSSDNTAESSVRTEDEEEDEIIFVGEDR